MLYEESGISPDVAAERGYYTARTRSEVPEAFKDYQKKPGLVVPMFSPNGKTVGYQLRPDKPRKGGPKYETPGGISPVVDVHPRMLEEARSGDGPLLITEGAKTGDAATSRGIATAVLAGVWMWCVPKVKPYRLKPCFDHIRLEGREVFVAFDSDCMSKAGVQEALAALVGALEDRGADVKVIYLPDAADGSKQGIDDYLASEAGGTVKEMFVLARKFNPADVGRIRLSRDERLRAGVKILTSRWWAEEYKGRGGHTERDVYLKLIEAAPKSGKIHADGIRVRMSWGALQVAAKVSRKALSKSLGRLEKRGLIYRDNEGRKADRTGAFVLRAKVDQYRERDASEGKATPELQTYDRGGLPLRAPRLRWSRPAFTPRRGFVSGTRKVRESKPQQPRERIERLGKIRGAIVDTLEVAGGTLTLHELCEVLHRKRPRDVRRRILPMLEEAGIIETVDDVITLAADWTARLDEARAAGGELEADEQAEANRKRKSRAYHESRKPQAASPSKPSAAGLEAIKRSHEKRAEHIAEHDEQAAAARAAEIAAKSFAKRYVYERVRALGRIRLGLLQEILRDEGGMPAYAEPAAKSLGCTIEKLPEYANQEFVFAPREWVA
jgi:ribosomal protein S19E (S16A)